MLYFAWTPGPMELIIILAVILLLFGPKKLPDLARSIGRSLSEFKRGKEEGAKLMKEDEGNEGEKKSE